MTDLICIIQARFGSSRLPGKILMPLKGAPALAHTIARARAIPGVDHVVCATTTGPENDAVVPVAEAAGASVFRGDEDDVLGRYHGAAAPFGARYVMRVTADCPLLDPQVSGALVRMALGEGADYGATAGWPHGLDTEVFTQALLEEAHASATAAVDREHVTLWMKRRTDIRAVELTPERNLEQGNRWVLDYPEDYAFLSALFELLPEGSLPSWREVFAVVDAHPELRAINRAQAEEWAAATARIYAESRNA